MRLTSLSRNTVRKRLKAAVLEQPRYRRSAAPGKLTPFHESLKMALKVDAHRPRHERRTTRALHSQIKCEGYGGGYSLVTDFVRALREGEGQSISTKAFVPLAFELGKAFQFDWSEEGMVVGGIYCRMQVSHLKLCASWAGAASGSMPSSSASAHSSSSMPGWVTAAGTSGTRCTIPSTTSSAWPRCSKNERPHLMPMFEPFDGYAENPARVSSTCLVVVARNLYSVPCELAGQTVSTRLYAGKIVVVARDEIAAAHERLSDRGQTKYDWQHYIPLVQWKPRARVRRGPFVAQATARRSWTCPSRCSSCAGPCCATRAGTA